MISLAGQLDPEIDWLSFRDRFGMPTAFGAGPLLPHRAYPGETGTVTSVAWGEKIPPPLGDNQRSHSATLDFSQVTPRVRVSSSNRRSHRAESVWGPRQTRLLLALWNLRKSWMTLSYPTFAPSWAQIWRATHGGLPDTNGYGGEWRIQAERDLLTMQEVILTVTDTIRNTDLTGPLLEVAFDEGEGWVAGRKVKTRRVKSITWHPYLTKTMGSLNVKGKHPDTLSLDPDAFFGHTGLSLTAYLFLPRQAIMRERFNPGDFVPHPSSSLLVELGYREVEVRYPEQRRIHLESLQRGLDGSRIGGDRGYLKTSVDFEFVRGPIGQGKDYRLLVGFESCKAAPSVAISRPARLALESGVTPDELASILASKRDLHDGETKYLGAIRSDWGAWSSYYATARAIIDGLGGEGRFAELAGSVAETISHGATTVTSPGRIFTYQIHREISRLAKIRRSRRKEPQPQR